jgi:eukaryotic-like serine/threonine-protein kinase
MKSKKSINILLFSILVGSILLSACSGSGALLAGSSWPGITAGEDGHVYVAYANEVVALNNKNGSKVWGYPESPSRTQLFFGQPAVVGDVVIAGSYDSNLSGINSSNGNESWKFDTATGKYISGILVDNDIIYAPNSDHSLYVLNSDGNLQWSFTADGALWAKPAFDDETLYIPCMDHNLYAVNRQTGNKVWVTELDGASIFSPVLVDGKLYLGTMDGSFYALNAANGKILWTEKLEATAIWSTPVVQNGKVFFGDLNGAAYAYDAETGSQIWSIPLDGSVVGGAVAYDSGIVFPTEGDNDKDTSDLVAISEDGTRLWTRSVTGKIMGTPVVVEDKLVFGVVKGEAIVYAFDFNGNQIWEYSVK